MKKIGLFLTLICTSFSTYSESRLEVAQAYCKSLYYIAEMTMTARQQDLPAYETSDYILGVVRETGANEQIKDISFSIIENAYKRPLIEGEENKKVVIDSFKESYYFTCMNALKDKI